MKKLMAILISLPILVGLGLWGWAAWPTPGVVQAAVVTPAPHSLCYADTITANEIISLTNAQRVNAGLAPLVENTLLDQAATLKAQDAVTNHYWAHVSPTGVQPWYWFRQAGYNYHWAGENLAQNFTTPTGLMTGWMASPGHRENILKPAYTEVGVAVVCGVTDRETTLVVAEYGSR